MGIVVFKVICCKWLQFCAQLQLYNQYSCFNANQDFFPKPYRVFLLPKPQWAATISQHSTCDKVGLVCLYIIYIVLLWSIFSLLGMSTCCSSDVTVYWHTPTPQRRKLNHKTHWCIQARSCSLLRNNYIYQLMLINTSLAGYFIHFPALAKWATILRVGWKLPSTTSSKVLWCRKYVSHILQPQVF